MRVIFGLVLLVGVALAGFAVYYAQDRFSEYQRALAQQRNAIVETTEVYVVTSQLRYGQTLLPENVRAVRWPADSVPFGAFTSMEDIFPEGPDVPRTVLRVMETDEPLLRAKVTPPGQDAGVASRLASGMRAFSLQVDVNSGVSGFLRPGDRVDVYWTGTIQGEMATRLIQSDVQIIAIDQIADEDRNNPMVAGTVTIEAPPEQIAALAQAQASGRVTLALVGVNEAADSFTAEVGTTATNATFLGLEDAVGPRVCYTRERRGAEVVQIQVPCPDE